jgi:hypothetical protein
MIWFVKPLTAKPSRGVFKVKERYYMIKLTFLKKEEQIKFPRFLPNTRTM